MREPLFDMTSLAAIVRGRRADQNLSVRGAGFEADVSFATIARVESGQSPDLATFLKLCDWLMIDPALFFRTRHESIRTVDAISQLLAEDPELDVESRDKIDGVIRSLYSAYTMKRSD